MSLQGLVTSQRLEEKNEEKKVSPRYPLFNDVFF